MTKQQDASKPHNRPADSEQHTRNKTLHCTALHYTIKPSFNSATHSSQTKRIIPSSGPNVQAGVAGSYGSPQRKDSTSPNFTVGQPPDMETFPENHFSPFCLFHQPLSANPPISLIHFLPTLPFNISPTKHPVSPPVRKRQRPSTASIPSASVSEPESDFMKLCHG